MAARRYDVVLTAGVAAQLGDGPPALQGTVAGIIAMLRVDPDAASQAVVIHADGDRRTVVFASGMAFLSLYLAEVEGTPTIVVTELIWLAGR